MRKFCAKLDEGSKEAQAIREFAKALEEFRKMPVAGRLPRDTKGKAKYIILDDVKKET